MALRQSNNKQTDDDDISKNASLATCQLSRTHVKTTTVLRLRSSCPILHTVHVRYTSDLRIVDNVASAAKTRCKKLAANKARLNRLPTELEELSIDAVDDNVLDGQIELTPALYIGLESAPRDELVSRSWCRIRVRSTGWHRSRTSDLWIVDTMASAMKTRSKKLVALNDRLNRLLAELDDLCIGSADAFEVEEQVSLMEETFRAADALQTEVELDLEGEERQAAIDDWAACHQRYRVGKSRARARMVEARGECPIDGDNVSAGRPAVRTGNGRLPEVTLPNFEEKVLEFPSFWALFEANIHKRGDLDNATKFTYLLSSTEGTARSAIEGIPLTPENYTQAVDILKARFGRPRMVIREHVAALWRAPACREMTARGIQSLVDEVTKHLRCLTAGRLPVSEALMPMLQDKFPPALIRAWDTNIGPDAAEDEDNLQKFLEFAQWQASLLAKSKREDPKSSAAKSEQWTPSKKPSRPEWKYGERIRSTAAALAVVAAQSCPFCSGEHKAEECEKRICPGGGTAEGWAQPAPEASPLRRTWYLPHHAVYQGVGDERKCRVVFDGASQHNGITLNSQLEAGPNLQIDLLRAIISFRRLCVGLQTDIEKMYLQIRVRADDRDACRFLWWDDEQKIHKYRLTRVCFGLTCSPFLAMGTVRSHAKQHYESAPRAAEEVQNNMYMDDLATSCDSVAEPGALWTSWRPCSPLLHKWASNEPDALRDLPVEKTTVGAGGRPWKTLEIYWERNEDYLTFVTPERRRSEGGDTKRQLLSTASGIFDPIGCLAPFLVRAKIIFQSLWERGLDWDEPLPEGVERPWFAWKRELGDLPHIRLPRALVPIPLDQVKRIELHAFCDASGRAYGTVVYLRVETSSGSVRVSLAAANTRVAPVKRLSLQRLELMGALIAARLIRYVQGALRLDIRSLSCWSDSEVTLWWIRSAASQWKPTTDLLETLPGEEQPGRRTEPRSIFEGNNCWWQGPRWFAEPTETWPQKRGPSKRNSLAPPDEDRSLQMALWVSVVTHAMDDVLDPGRYGDIEKLFQILKFRSFRFRMSQIQHHILTRLHTCLSHQIR
ncbi:hypothetical protein T05_2497, partial [Trichinella murrelli]